MKIQGWTKTKDRNPPDGFYYIHYEHNEKAKYTNYSGKPDEVHKAYVWIALAVTWQNDKVHQVRIGRWNFENNNYPSSDRSFKTKQEALDFAYDFMRSHPNG